MTLASGQKPYIYGSLLPLRSGPDSWPGNGTGWLIGPSGDVLEKGMFVINAELRKWGFTDENELRNSYRVYTHPIVTPSGFEPKPNGDTLEGLVGDVHALVDVDNIEQMRTLLKSLFSRYSNDSDYTNGDFREAWLTSAYPQSPSGYRHEFDFGAGFLIVGRDFLRPPLEEIQNGDQIIDTNLHWLGGSGVLFDIDFGEVVFNTFPWPGERHRLAATDDGQRFHFSPFFPSFQKSDGSIITLTGREQSDLAFGTFKTKTNFDAIASGKVQFDGYGILPVTRVRLCQGNDANFHGTLGVSSDFTLPIQGLRRVNDGTKAVANDSSARTYWTPPTGVASGVYRILTDTQRSLEPNIAIPSGRPVSLWPPGGIGEVAANEEYGRSIGQTSDGNLTIDPRQSVGYQVFDDAIWMTTRNGGGADGGLSGTADSRGLFPISPHNGAFMWYRPADRTIATSGNRPVISQEGPDAPSPGHFGVHIGLAKFGASEIIRVSRSWDDNITSTTCGSMSNADERTTTVYFQRYSLPGLTLTEQSATYVFCEETVGGTLGNAISDITFDGTNYWLADRGTGRVSKWTSALVFDGLYQGNIGPRRHYVNADYLYTIDGSVSVGDPLLTDANMLAFASASGIGKWSVASDPVDITNSIGTIDHDSAKPIRAETHVGFGAFPGDTRIHDIIYVDPVDVTHLRPGIWCLITFDGDMWMFRLTERSTHYEVMESIHIHHTADAQPPTGRADDFPYELIHLDID